MCSDWKLCYGTNRRASSSTPSHLLPSIMMMTQRIKTLHPLQFPLPNTPSQAFALLPCLLRETVSARSVTDPGVPLHVVWGSVTYVHAFLRQVPSGEKADGSAALGLQQLSGCKWLAKLGVPRKGVRASPSMHVLPMEWPLVESLLPATSVRTN